jgi:hypothetical protein
VEQEAQNLLERWAGEKLWYLELAWCQNLQASGHGTRTPANACRLVCKDALSRNWDGWLLALDRVTVFEVVQQVPPSEVMHLTMK